MKKTTHTILMILLVSLAAGALNAQDAEVVVEADAEAAVANESPADLASEEPVEEQVYGTSYDLRSQFSRVLRQYPPELGTILKLDPTLLSNDAFLAGYPELAAFVAINPEVRRNPGFYLAEFSSPSHRHSLLSDFLEVVVIFSSFLLVTLALAWLVRTVIEQKRWNRLSQTQSEVHTRLLERFGTTEELLQYIRTPAGSKFLESAPIPLHEPKPERYSPLTRVLLSIQIGVVVAAGAIGAIVVSFRIPEEPGLELFALGVVALCVGIGFISSGAVSMVMSRRFGLLSEGPGQAESLGGTVDEPGVVR